MYIYKIFHEYQIGDQSVFFKTSIKPSTMRDLLASLQFHFEEYIDEDDSLCERAAVEIINTIYSAVEYIEDTGYSVDINTHWNREERCGVADDLIRRFYDPILTQLMKDEQEKELARLKREIPELKEDSQ